MTKYNRRKSVEPVIPLNRRTILYWMIFFVATAALMAAVVFLSARI